jgi:hypothetical protein
MSRPETLALNRFPAETPAGREPWLDVLRGVAVAGMIVVNNPGSWDHVYWHGWTGADLIFPLFLFIVGVSMSFAFSDAKWRDGRLRSKVLRKAIAITADYSGGKGTTRRLGSPTDGEAGLALTRGRPLNGAPSEAVLASP